MTACVEYGVVYCTGNTGSTGIGAQYYGLCYSEGFGILYQYCTCTRTEENETPLRFGGMEESWIRGAVGRCGVDKSCGANDHAFGHCMICKDRLRIIQT